MALIFNKLANVFVYLENKAVGIMKKGHVFTIEPMINIGNNILYLLWPSFVFVHNYREGILKIAICTVNKLLMLIAYNEMCVCVPSCLCLKRNSCRNLA